jgi:PiT family inorganic phosphate transporter
MPPIWIRMLLWTTCGLVSFFHGQNDGQKGVGLVMMILIAILPASFSLDSEINLQSTNANVMVINKIISTTDTTQFGKEEFKNFNTIKKHAEHFAVATAGINYSEGVAVAERFELRKDIVKITKSAEKLLKSENVAISKNDINSLKIEIKSAKKLVEYAPSWVIIMISVSLGLGTMIGWKRIVKTIGEKIGKQHMSYAQGASAEIVASMGIGVASAYGVPVSTTHMLSSGIMGSMVAKKGLKNLQRKTITNIFLAWVLTLPVTMILSGALFLLFRAIL